MSKNCEKFRNIHYNYYIARDKDNSLYLYTKLPEKCGFIWDTMGDYYEIDSKLYSFIKWEDEKPYKCNINLLDTNF